MKQPQKKQPKKQQPQNTELTICCPYFDDDAKACSHPQCIRMVGMECKYCNKKIK